MSRPIFGKDDRVSHFFRNHTHSATVGIALGLLGFVLLYNSTIDVPDISHRGWIIALNLAVSLTCTTLSWLILTRRIDSPRGLETSMGAGLFLAIFLTFMTGVVWPETLWLTAGYTMALAVAAGVTFRRTGPFTTILLLLLTVWVVAVATTSGQPGAESAGTNLVIIALLISSACFALLNLERGTHARATQRLETQLRYDVLTGVLNRRGFEVRLTKLRRTTPESGSFWCAYVDVDHFKGINDQMGHDYGDDVLRVVARGLTEACGPEAAVSRWGGDEFVVISSGDPPSEKTVEDTVGAGLDRQDLRASVTAGITRVGWSDPFDPEAVIARADQRMYERREARRGEAPHRRSPVDHAA